MAATDNPDLDALKSQLRQDLERIHGPLLGGPKLVAALGHSNLASLRQARRRGRVSVPLFTLPQRRGFFALTLDVANWLAEARLTAVAPTTPTETEGATDPPET